MGRNEKVLVTGGAGYIGSILVPLLLREGFEVTVLDNLMYGQSPLLEAFHGQPLRLVKGDVRDSSLLKDLLSKNDIILPLACLTGAPICERDPITARAVNFEAIQSLLKWKSPNQKMIFPNTNSGYGIGESSKLCDERSPLRPVSLYGRLKVEIEQQLLDSGECVTFRFATVFGLSPRMRLDLLVNDFTYRALRDRSVVLFEPHFKRNFLHVRDAARAFVHAIDHYSTMKGEAFNVGLSDANLSKEELCQVIQRFLPRFQYTVATIGEDPDKRNYIVSNSKIESTGFRTQTNLEDGIQELIRGLPILIKPYYAND